MKKTGIILLAGMLLSACLQAQVRFSLCNDLGLQRSFKKDQRFWAGGHTLQGNFHFSKSNTVYAWISYYSEGKFSNQLTATAKLNTTVPAQINFTNSALMRFKQISIGWKKYFRGDFETESKLHLYGYAGFGIILGRVINTYSVSLDSVQYNIPVKSGKANFSRLTADFGMGTEWSIGSEIFLYSEIRAWVPTSSYPSKYLFVNQDAPLVGMLNFGLRILF